MEALLESKNKKLKKEIFQYFKLSLAKMHFLDYY